MTLIKRGGDYMKFIVNINYKLKVFASIVYSVNMIL